MSLMSWGAESVEATIGVRELARCSAVERTKHSAYAKMLASLKWRCDIPPIHPILCTRYSNALVFSSSPSRCS